MDANLDASDVDCDDELAHLAIADESRNEQKQRVLSNALRIVEAEMVRTRLLRSEYLFPRCTRKLALALLALWSAWCLMSICWRTRASPTGFWWASRRVCR